MMRKQGTAVAVALMLAGAALGARPAAGAGDAGAAEAMVPSIRVNGDGEVRAMPDRAVVRLGAQARGSTAAAAQDQVNKAVGAMLEAIKGEGIPAKQIRTVGLRLWPVYEQPRPNEAQQGMPAIVGYQAGNTVEVELDQVDRVGPVIDAAIKAGANQLEGLEFSLRDDSAQRREALRKAVVEARGRARAIAEALGVTLGDVMEAEEGGVQVVPLQARAMMAEHAGGAGTSAEPGEIRVQASVTVRYRLGGGAGRASAEVGEANK